MKSSVTLSELTHYTSSIDAMIGIVANGFAWVPNRRGLISDFVPYHDFAKREPQQFGMISFTELDPDSAMRHRRNFGDFGISVSREWAQRHAAQRVIYVDRQGPLFDALRFLFTRGYEQARSSIRSPDDDALNMAYTNKTVAGTLGAPLWANLLQVYEYIEPSENASHQEWRIVHPFPVYGYAESTQEIIRDVSPPKGWGQEISVLRIDTSQITRLICPASKLEELKSRLPAAYRGVQIYCFDSRRRYGGSILTIRSLLRRGV